MAKLLKKKTGILASRVVVRPHIPWHFRLLGLIIGITLLLALSWGMYETGKNSVQLKDNAMQAKLDTHFDQATCSQKNKKELCSQVSGLIRQLQMHNTTGTDLAKQVKILGDENNRLKEELAFFQHLLSGTNEISAGVAIYRFNLKKGQSSGEYRYTLSLVQGGQRPKDFQGDLKFSVNLLQNDKRKIVPLTSKHSSKDFSVNFKFYHRMEESFQVPADAKVESLQVQVFEKDSTKAVLTQTVKPAA